ncbi:DNA alkylation repair protein [Alkalilimnicola ehrlichii]|uniref:DNA alkylation repair protein n=1 Tax=Alkalilimnicola ehrlichii TaxID=351052 RepID=UPI0015F25CB9|nr:DNA alkylation repair protein [Alkalilimnicola ehrlichii]
MLKAILDDLEAHRDPEYRARIRDHFQMNVDNFLGVRTPKVRKIAAEHFRALRGEPFAEVRGHCEALLGSHVYECKLIAFDWSFRCRRSFQESDFKVFESWLSEYVDDWSDCDDLCTHSLGFLLLTFPASVHKLSPWVQDRNRWLRRAAAVSLIYGLRRGEFLQAACDIADGLLEDEDHLVQKAYAWMLKEASKQYPREIYAFLLGRRTTMVRSALRYAAEKLPAAERRQLLQ